MQDNQSISIRINNFIDNDPRISIILEVCKNLGLENEIQISQKKNTTLVQSSIISCKYKECGEIFENSEKLEQHIDQFHKIYKCSFEGCKKSFSGEKQFRRHLNVIHYQLKSYKCQICGKAYNQSHSNIIFYGIIN